MRGELKAKFRPIVELALDFSSGHNKAIVKKNRERVEYLKEGQNFTFKTMGDREDERKGLFKTALIQKGADVMWFTNKNDEGVVYHHHFKPFPVSALALLLTAIECCIDEWATGTRTDIPFTTQDYRSVYEVHLKCLREFEKHTREHGLLKKICKKIYTNGR
ncbi:hypothetical protein BV22DRAFT_1024399 [Leucogyrophana mollusca]|uniref:Uncharacterized protein n=1 Tax=Leucogyrophana mollusca TaxID=85980 RepID=A0ACB8AYS7_9AGAM|nr:hypothetical protein BV22DRAFT_1024399 [Leucogyrophana mollusca]